MLESDDLFVSEQNDVSQRWAIFEDDGTTAWLYLTEPDNTMPVATCWLYNRVETPAKFEGVKGQPPVVPQTHAGPGSTSKPPAEEAVRFKWSADGDSLAVLFGSDLIGFIVKGNRSGYCKHISVSGTFGNVLDLMLFERVFSSP